MEMCSPISAGTTTAGMVLPARDDFDCGYGFGLCLPFAKVFTPSGLELEGKGMTPQLEINFQTPDTQVMPGMEIASLLGMIE
jgi:C-terminal processing protease CtpA/Prc